MSKKKARVSAIQIEYADGESKQLSVEDARALYEQLHELFGENTVVVPSVPIIIDRERERQPEPWKRTPCYPAAPVWMNERSMTDMQPTVPQVWCSTADATGG